MGARSVLVRRLLGSGWESDTHFHDLGSRIALCAHNRIDIIGRCSVIALASKDLRHQDERHARGRGRASIRGESMEVVACARAAARGARERPTAARGPARAAADGRIWIPDPWAGGPHPSDFFKNPHRLSTGFPHPGRFKKRHQERPLESPRNPPRGCADAATFPEIILDAIPETARVRGERSRQDQTERNRGR